MTTPCIIGVRASDFENDPGYKSHIELLWERIISQDRAKAEAKKYSKHSK